MQSNRHLNLEIKSNYLYQQNNGTVGRIVISRKHKHPEIKSR